MNVRGEYVFHEGAFPENGDMHQRFQEPVQQTDPYTDPYEALSRYNRVGVAYILHGAPPSSDGNGFDFI